MSSDEEFRCCRAGELFARGIITAHEYAVCLWELDNKKEEE